MLNSTEATELDCSRRHRGQWQAVVMAALLIAVAAQQSGCAAQSSFGSSWVMGSPISSQSAVNNPQVKANTLASGLAERDQRLNSLQTPDAMEYSGPRRHFKARQQPLGRRA